MPVKLAIGLLFGLTVCLAHAEDVAVTVVYEARKIVTMDAVNPFASHVAVSEGRIVALGSKATVHEALADRDVTYDDRFRNMTLLPGFIEPHLHLLLAGMFLPMEFVTSDDWDLPGGTISGVRGRDAYLRRLREIEAHRRSNDGWLDIWGFDPQFHGNITRSDLDEVSSVRPILVWHRWSREIYLNTPALERMNVTVEERVVSSNVAIESGRLAGQNLKPLLSVLINRLLARDRFGIALRMARDMIHAGGITTIGDGGFGSLGFDQELEALKAAGFDSDHTPFRSVLLIDGTTVGSHMSHDVTREWIESLPARGTHRILLPKRAVRLYVDVDGYPPLIPVRNGRLGGGGLRRGGDYTFEYAASVYWNAGFRIHVETRSEQDLEQALAVFETLRDEDRRGHARIIVDNAAHISLDQVNRIARFDSVISLNPKSVPLRSIVDAGVPLVFHSDSVISPARPLALAWMSVAGPIAGGGRLERDQRVSVDDALRAITINAARQLGMEDEIGSIAVGKRADFAVLENDPYDLPIEELRSVAIWGTVFEGEPYPLD